MFVHDVIKIQYTRNGYLPNYPYHMVSDEEMCDAFIHVPESISEYVSDDFFGPSVEDTSSAVDWFTAFQDDVSIMYFKDNYPLIDESIETYYKALVNRIFYEIQEFKNNLDSDKILPDWVYSYMLGVCIGPESDKLDIHDFISSMGVDNLEDEYNLSCAVECLKISNEWLKKLILPKGSVKRPPTMFGEPHVLKSIRLDQESLVLSDLTAN